MTPKTTTYIDKLAATAKLKGIDPSSVPAFRRATQAREDRRLGDYRRITKNIRSFVSGREESPS